MKIGELKEFIKNLPDDMPVLVPGHDHSLSNLTTMEVADLVSDKWCISRSYGYVSGIPFKGLVIGHLD